MRMSRNLLICRYVLELHHSTLHQGPAPLHIASRSYTTPYWIKSRMKSCKKHIEATPLRYLWHWLRYILALLYWVLQKIWFELNQNTFANLKLKQHSKVYHLSTTLSWVKICNLPSSSETTHIQLYCIGNTSHALLQPTVHATVQP